MTHVSIAFATDDVMTSELDLRTGRDDGGKWRS